MQEPNQAPHDTATRDVVFRVRGMSCGSCVARVEQVLAGQEGVGGAVVDLASSQARVTLTSAASTGSIVEAVTKVGYTISLLSS